jgi:hypothetical protein
MGRPAPGYVGVVLMAGAGIEALPPGAFTSESQAGFAWFGSTGGGHAS